MRREQSPWRGSSRRLRNAAIGLGATIMMAFTATGVHAAWTASTSFTAQATTAAVGLTTEGIPTLAYSYPSQATSPVRTITVRNTGSAPITITGFDVSGAASTGLGASVRLDLWVKTGSSCTVPSTPYATTLTDGWKALAGLPTINPNGFFDLCARTTLTGPNQEGQTFTPSIAFKGQLGSNWVAADSARSFTQLVLGVPNVQKATCTDVIVGGRGVIDLSWDAVSGARYVILYRGNELTVPNGQTSIRLEHSQLGGQGTTLSIHAYVGNDRSSGVLIKILRDPPSISCDRA